ncbi:MAG: hypothetical protein CME88_01735 [Hirschia sp.]|nr:hypothetical protein [Hirschia sp.]MBF17082.1 hypothetical protein [Hirschia sp.]|tara:strand:- start:84 stop:548 length:465 start_codon:yes stop_codon:yes gene_type:complete
MTDFLMTMTPWHWVAIGLVLVSVEMLVGTFDLLWISAAAFVAALFAALAPAGMNGWEAQTAVFTIAAIGFVVLGRTVFSGLRNPPSSHPDLNDRVGKMIGKPAVVTKGFVGGSGRVKFGDSEWSAEAEDGGNPAMGQNVIVTGGKGSVVSVRPA